MNDRLQEAQQLMEKAFQHLERSLAKIKADRVVPDMIEDTTIDYEGTPTLLKYIASIDAQGVGTLAIYPRDKKANNAIKAAFVKHNPHNFTITDQGDCLYANRAPLTQEGREALAKQVATQAQAGKVAVQNIRAATKKSISKEGTQDEVKQNTKELQRITDLFTARIETLQQEKKARLLKI